MEALLGIACRVVALWAWTHLQHNNVVFVTAFSYNPCPSKSGFTGSTVHVATVGLCTTPVQCVGRRNLITLGLLIKFQKHMSLRVLVLQPLVITTIMLASTAALVRGGGVFTVLGGTSKNFKATCR